MKTTILCLLLFPALPLLAAAQTKWQTTAGNISFTIKNRGSNVAGRFTGFNATLIFSPDQLATSKLKGYVTVGSINTGNRKRDADLREEKYFDASKYRIIELVSTRISKQGSGYLGNFNVTIKGVTRSMAIPFTFTTSGNTAEFRSSFTVNRRDFGVGGKSGLALFLSDDAHVSVLVRARK